MKVCATCEAEKPLSEFVPKRRDCKACIAIKKQAYRDSPKGKAATAAYNRKYAQEHAAKIQTQRKARDRSIPDARRAVQNAKRREGRSQKAEDINARRRERYSQSEYLRRANVERTKAWIAERSEYISEQRRAYYLNNREAVKKRIFAYQKARPEQTKLLAKITANRRRARLLNAGGDYTRQDIERLLTLQRCKCANCGDSLKKGYHIDHRIPVALGGSNHRDNIELLCPPCNYAKAAKHPVAFAQENGRLL
jgi:5-methylcytosine-specific restriction endonuclease McrA